MFLHVTLTSQTNTSISNNLNFTFNNNLLIFYFYYLINKNAFLFYFNFFSFKKLKVNLKLMKIKLNIKKSFYNFKIFQIFKHFANNKFIFRNKFSFNKFFNYLNLRKKNIIFFKKKPSKAFHKYFPQYNHNLNKNWNFLIANIPPLFAWLYTKFFFNIKKSSNIIVKKSPSAFSSKSFIFWKENIPRKLIIKNFHYFLNLKIDTSTLFYIFKFQEDFFSTTSQPFLSFSKPFLFLNNDDYIPDIENSLTLNHPLIINYKFYLQITNEIFTQKILFAYWYCFWQQPDQLQFAKTTKLFITKEKYFFFSKKKLSFNLTLFKKKQQKKNMVIRLSRITFLTKKTSIEFLFYFNQIIQQLKIPPLSNINEKSNNEENLLFSQIIKNFNSIFLNSLNSQKQQKHLFYFLKLKQNIKKKTFWKKKTTDFLKPFRSRFIVKYYNQFNVINKDLPKLNLYKNKLFLKNFKSFAKAYKKFINVLNEDCANISRIMFHLKTWNQLKNKSARAQLNQKKKKTRFSFFLFKRKNHSMHKLNFRLKLKLNNHIFFNNNSKKNTFEFDKVLNFTIDKSVVLTTYEKLCFFSNHDLAFISSYFGFLYLTNDALEHEFHTQDFSDLRKELHSFSSKYEMHKWAIKNYLQEKAFDFNDEDFLNFEVENVNDSFFSSNKLTFLYCNNLNKLNSLTDLKKNLTDSLLAINIVDDPISIKRIKFKPGYRRIWKEARMVLKNSLNVKFKYQYKLTKYLLRFNKYSRFSLFLTYEFTLINILKQSNFFFYHEFIHNFLKNNTVFINGLTCTNLHFQLHINDFIQLIVSSQYYIMYKTMWNFFLLKKIKMKNRLNLHKANDLSLEKKNKNKLPNWLLKEKNIENDSPQYLELDFFSMSIFILYEPFLTTDLNINNFYDVKFDIINMYNWKYIT